MDVDALSTSDKQELLKRGACFNCKKIGHMAQTCPMKLNGQGYRQKMNPKEMHTHIRALLKEHLNEGEHEQLTKIAEKEGGF